MIRNGGSHVVQEQDQPFGGPPHTLALDVEVRKLVIVPLLILQKATDPSHGIANVRPGIGFLMGAPTEQTRTIETTRLLTIGVNMFKQVQLAKAGQSLTRRLPVRNGKKEEIDLRYAADLRVSERAERAPEVVLVEDLSAAVEVPVYEGETVGKASIKLGDQALTSVDIVAGETVEKASLIERLWR